MKVLRSIMIPPCEAYVWNDDITPCTASTPRSACPTARNSQDSARGIRASLSGSAGGNGSPWADSPAKAAPPPGGSPRECLRVRSSALGEQRLRIRVLRLPQYFVH